MNWNWSGSHLYSDSKTIISQMRDDYYDDDNEIITVRKRIPVR